MKTKALLRWARMNVRRHGILATLRPSLRGRHAGVGHGVRVNPFGRAHDILDGTPAMDLVRALRKERLDATAVIYV